MRLVRMSARSEEHGVMGDAIFAVSDACLQCKHLAMNQEPSRYELTCRAYPDGIVREIIETDEPHKTVRSDQVGDYVFEPVEDPEAALARFPPVQGEADESI